MKNPKVELKTIAATQQLKLEPVLIFWKDAHAVFPGWTSLEDMDKDDCIIQTIGWMIPDIKPGHVVVVQSVGNPREDNVEDHVDSGIAIPEAMIVDIQELKVKGARS